MKYRTGLMGLITGALIAGAASWAADEVTVKVWPDKVLYDVKQNAKFDVTLTNTRKEPVKGTLDVSLFWEMEDTRKLLEQGVDLAAGETKTVTTEWPTREVLGCEVRADFKDGQKILATGSEYFNVCRSKDSQRVGIHVEYPDLFTFPEKAYLDSIPAKVLSLRMAYGNIVEHFGWCPDIYCELAPQRDEWCSSYWQSKAAIQKAVEEEHKQGMKSLHYAAGYLWALPGAEMMRRHPDWIFYRESGQPWGGGIINVRKLDYERNPDRAAMHKLAGGGLQGVFPDFSRKEAVEFGVQQLIESKKMFG
ncbi:MAG: hypothetical protein KKD76_03355, partial [Verrucomicrobia bacterium]|nr:hypothetical protein [Verrucomicrobiota bacterium]